MTPEEFTKKLAEHINTEYSMRANVLSDEPMVIGIDDKDGGLYFVNVMKAD